MNANVANCHDWLEGPWQIKGETETEIKLQKEMGCGHQLVGKIIKEPSKVHTLERVFLTGLRWELWAQVLPVSSSVRPHRPIT